MTLIFDIYTGGHHMEYLHHYYMGAMQDSKENYVFVVPESFNEKKKLFQWPKADNISFVFIPENKCPSKNTKSLVILIKQAFLLRKYVKQLKPQKVSLVVLIHFVFYFLFCHQRNIKIEGILYQIPLYGAMNQSFISRKWSFLKLWICAKNKSLQKVFVLNDSSSAVYLNRLFETQKFIYIPDPYSNQCQNPKNIRGELGIADSKKMLLVFGELSNRKGTLEILRAIQLLSDEEKKRYAFVFAGRIASSVYDEFMRTTESLALTVQVVVKPFFVDFDYLNDLCYSCDCILMPHKLCNLSSGTISYAAQYNKPVLGPAQGLIGKLIRRYHLGVCAEKITPENIYSLFNKALGYQCDGRAYIESHTVGAFIKVLL